MIFNDRRITTARRWKGATSPALPTRPAPSCAHCNSTNVTKAGSAAGPRLVCRDCGLANQA